MTFPATFPQKRTAPQPEPRIWKGRVYTKGGPVAGFGFLFKAPYGEPQAAVERLLRATLTRQIIRFELGPVPASETREWDSTNPRWRDSLTRYEPAFERLGLQLGIDWSA